MSLFKTQEFWNTKCGNDEEFDQLSLHLSNIDNSEDNSDKIIVGSHSGILRIFALKSSKLKSDKLFINELNYDENDVLLETQFPWPILQITSGILLSANEKRQLLILFPTKICVYSVTSDSGLSNYGFSYTIVMLYEHKLPRSAFCLTIGPFGRVKKRDFICVQSLDCSLIFYEQESYSFMRTMSNSLLPTSFTYIKSIDSFLIQSANWNLQCFSYQVLAISAHRQEDNKPNCKVLPDWTFELGEPILHVESINYQETSLIIVLSERSLYILNTNGLMFWQKKFDFKPIVFDCYLLNENSKTEKNENVINKNENSIENNVNQNSIEKYIEKNLVILLITEMSTLLIYKNKELKWASQLPFQYILIKRASFYLTKEINLTGCLVFISSIGQLSIAYLGTSPSINIINKSANKANRQKNMNKSLLNKEEKEKVFLNTQLDEDNFTKELNDLNNVINAYNTDFNTLIKLTNQQKNYQENDIILKEIILQKTDDKNLNTFLINNEDVGSQKVLKLKFNLEVVNQELNNVVIFLVKSNCFNSVPSSLSYDKLKTFSTIEDLNFKIFCDPNKLFSFKNNQVYLVINYLNEKNLPRVFIKSIYLPLSLFISCSIELERKTKNLKTFNSKEQSIDQFLIEDKKIEETDLNIYFFSKIKLNLNLFIQQLINTNKSKLNYINEKNEENLNKSNNILIKFFNNKLSNVLISLNEIDSNLNKDNQTNYRAIINGEDLHSKCFIYNLFIQKLFYLIKSNEVENIFLSLDNYFKNFYFSVIRNHLKIRQNIFDEKIKLEQNCERLRIIQKRILIKLKDQNNFNMKNLESLLNYQHKKIVNSVNHILNLQENLEDESIKLNCYNQLIYRFFKLSKKSSKENCQILKCCLGIVSFNQTKDLETWQERTEASVLYIFKNYFKKTNKFTKVKEQKSSVPTDCEELINLLNIVINKIEKEILFKCYNTIDLPEKKIKFENDILNEDEEENLE